MLIERDRLFASAAWQNLVIKGVDAGTIEALEAFADQEGVDLAYV